MWWATTICIQLDIENYYTSGSQQYTFEAENALTSALAQVSRTTAYKLYQLTGHGELALETDFTDTLDNSGVTVQDLNLLTTDATVPEDAAALLINDRRRTFSLDAAAIKTY